MILLIRKDNKRSDIITYKCSSSKNIANPPSLSPQPSLRSSSSFAYLAHNQPKTAYANPRALQLPQTISSTHSSNWMSTEQYALLSFSSEQTKDILSNQTLFHECGQSAAVCPSQWIDANDNAAAPHPASNRSDYTPAQQAIAEETNKSPTKCTFIAWASDNQKLSADTALREATTKKTFFINPQTGHAQYAYFKL